jgi:adenylate/nucleoside-diphosphate kinase
VANILLVLFRTPWKYLNQKLPKKLPPKKIACDINALPLIGYLEQTVSNKLNEALSSVGKFKPKYPYKSLDASASEYMALHLKCKIRVKHKKTLFNY